MSSKYGLGRGMFALVNEQELDAQDSKDSFKLEIEKILPNRYQPRKNFDEEALSELADSIKEKGIIQPVVVTELGDGRYELVVGERRWRAAKLAGLATIPAIIKNFSDADRLEIALIENIQRQDLNPIESALAYKEIMEKSGINQEELSKRVGKNRSSIANTLRLLKLPEAIRDKIVTGEISEGHARAILSLGNMDTMLGLAALIAEKGLSVREAEEMSRDPGAISGAGKNVSRETVKRKDHVLNDIQERFIKTLGAKVHIKGTHKKGKIEIHYFSRQELENIFHQIIKK